jgi:hypothetical protein
MTTLPINTMVNHISPDAPGLDGMGFVVSGPEDVHKGGFTVWKMKSGTPIAIHTDDLSKAVAECLR